LIFNSRASIVAVAAKDRLPEIYWSHPFVDGGRMAYGSNIADNFRRAAAYVDKILKGTRPGELAVAKSDELRAGDQPQDRQSARPHDS
jgi:putative ABC transport system substrate-binding protein